MVLSARELRYEVLNQRVLLVLHALLLAVVMLINYSRNGHDHDAWSWSRVIGLAIFAPSFICSFLSRWELAGYAAFTVFPVEPRKLVKTGPYKYLTHPIYIFSSLNMFGYLLMVQSEYGLLALIFGGIPLQLWRARKEEELLQKRFAFQYTSYKENLRLLLASRGSVHDKAMSAAVYVTILVAVSAVIEMGINGREMRIRVK